MRKWLSRFTLIFLVLISGVCSAQVSEKQMILEQNFHDHQYDDLKRTYVFSDSKSALVKYNPVSIVFGSLLYFYQVLISVQLSTKCSYDVSCSNFAKVAIKEYGPLKGIALGMDRLMRCNQLAAKDIEHGDIDFVNYKLKDPISRYRIKRKTVE